MEDILEEVNQNVKNDERVTVQDMRYFASVLRSAKGIQLDPKTKTALLLQMGNDPIKVLSGYQPIDVSKLYDALRKCVVDKLDRCEVHTEPGIYNVFISGDIDKTADADIVAGLKKNELL
jgi:hypothetical protein